jgi:regulator of cell morphogenesis and NO signaling
MDHSATVPFTITTPLAAIVTADPRTAAIFDRLGLDYCCHGQRTLEQAARDRNVPISQVVQTLGELAPAAPGGGPAAWDDLAELTAHVIERHHGYVREVSPVIEGWLEKLVSRHRAHHPELVEVRTTFEWIANDLRTHMMKEEHVLFPYIVALAEAARTSAPLPASPFGTIANPIRAMEREHEEAGDQLARLRELTNGYVVPADGCTTYRLCYEELARYEADLHRHVHLENNVLFPRAVELERTLMAPWDR